MPIPLNFPIAQFLAMKPSAKVAVPDAPKTDLLAPFITSALNAATKASAEYRNAKNYQEEVSNLADYYDKKGLTDLSSMLRNSPSLAPNYGGAIAGENTQAKREKVLAGVTALAGQEMKFNEEKQMNKEKFSQTKELQKMSDDNYFKRDARSYAVGKEENVFKARLNVNQRESDRVKAELEVAIASPPGPERDNHVNSLLEAQKELSRQREEMMKGYESTNILSTDIVPPTGSTTSATGVAPTGSEDRNNVAADNLPEGNRAIPSKDNPLSSLDETPVINPADKTIPKANIVPDPPASQSTEKPTLADTQTKSVLDKNAEREAEAAKIRMKQSDRSRSANKDIVSSHLFSNEAMLKANTDNGKLTPEVASAFQSSIETAKKLIAAGNIQQAEKILSELDTQIPKSFDPLGSNKRKEYTSIGDNLFGPINDKIEKAGEARIDLAVDAKGDIYVSGGATPKYTKIESGGDGTEDIKSKILGYLSNNITTSNRDEILKDLGVKINGKITPNMIRELAKKTGGSSPLNQATPSVQQQPSINPQARSALQGSIQKARGGSVGILDWLNQNK